MTLATRCSRCRATFRLDPSTLSAAEGWVRCGRCREVFNAVETLFHAKPLEAGTVRAAAVDSDTQAPDAEIASTEAAARTQAPPSADASPASTDPAGDAESGAAARPTDAGVPSESSQPTTGSKEVMASLESTASPEPTASSESLEAELSAEFINIAEPMDSTSGSTTSDGSKSAPSTSEDDDRDLEAARTSLFGRDTQFGEEQEQATRAAGADGIERMSLWPDPPAAPRRKTRRARPKVAAHRRDRDFELSETTVDVEIGALPSEGAVDRLIESNRRDTSFSDYEPTSRFEIPTRARRHRRPSPQLAMRVGAILLGTMLALQGVLHARHSIAARWPGVEPALEQLCAPLGCEVEAPRDLQALQVQSVSFHEAEGQGNFVLAVVLLNRSGLRVKMPALDLRISDARGETIARRVLNPSEFAPRSQPIAPGTEANLRIRLRIDHPYVNGYEVSVFYP